MKKLALTATVALTVIAFGTDPAAAAEMAAAPTDTDAATDSPIGAQQDDSLRDDSSDEPSEPIDAESHSNTQR